jgi:hypothetical protein
MFLTANFNSVYRVQWLRSKARYERWEEKLKKVEYEMGWTINFYEWKESLWQKRAVKSAEAGEMGHKSYALEQRNMWVNFGEDARTKFGERPNVHSLR